MRFAGCGLSGRDMLFAMTMALMVVPLQLAFIPVLSLYADLAGWATALNIALGCTGQGCQVDCKEFRWSVVRAYGVRVAFGNLFIAELHYEYTARIAGIGGFGRARPICRYL